MTGRHAPKGIAEAVQNVDVPGDLDEFASALSARHRGALRIRRDTNIDRLPIELRHVPWYTLGYQPVHDTPKPAHLWSFVTGDFYLQDAGSLLALAAASADSDRWNSALVCDLCASPGGKASALLEAMGERTSQARGGFVLANEVIRSRLGALQWNLARTGSDRYAISNRDPDQLADRLPGVFDLVLVDAPCSGQALLGRGKQKLAALKKKQIQHSAARQQRIVDAAIRLLRPGGMLVYSTCTFSFEENEAQIQRLVQSGPFHTVDHERLRSYQSEPGCYRLWPHRNDCAGSFAASIVTEELGAASSSSLVARRGHSKLDSGLKTVMSEFFEDDGSLRFHQFGSTLVGWPSDAPAWVEQIAESGPELLHRTGQTWKPSHAAALKRVARGRFDHAIDLDEQQAQKFMRGEPIESPAKGWHIVRYFDRPLGWVKGNGTVAKNHLPAAARVRSGPLIGRYSPKA